MNLFDVAIIGCGPTGATLANLLAQRGVKVLVLDREAAMYHLPRAVHFDDEVMRVFQSVGIADDLVKKLHINPGMKFVDDSGALLLDWPRPQEITMHGWNASYRLHQPDLEHFLREKLATHGTARFAASQHVTDMSQDGTTVTIAATDRKTGAATPYQARYVVGCDGANSFTRRAIKAEMDDLGFEERWLVVDLLLKRPRPDLGDHSIQFCNPDRPMTYCRSPGIRRRWEITVLDTESDEEITAPGRVWSLLSRWISPDDATLERASVYTFNSKIARTWRRDRILIAGDAAHLTPPFMGQGMCTGIRDAANLAWKLSAVIQDGCDDALLDSYALEREPHARAYIEGAMRLGGLINSLDRESALQLAQAQEDGSAKMRSIAPKLGASAVMQSGDPDDGVGRPFAQVLLNNGQRLDDAACGRHLLVSRKPASDRIDGVVVLNAHEHPQLIPELDRLKTNAIWIRPDMYVAATSDDGDVLLSQFRQLV